VSLSDAGFTADDINRLLTELAEVLRQQGLEAKLFIVGGAAMALAYNASRSTNDIDGVFEPRERVLDAAREIAERHGLATNWLNDAVRAIYMPPHEDAHPIAQQFGTSLSVEVASADYILAMKAMSTRHSDGDRRDAARLCSILGYTKESDIEATIKRYFGPTSHFGAQELWFERIIETLKLGDY